MEKNYILAVDQGTSSTKAMVFNRDGTLVASASRPVNTKFTPDGRAEQDPEEIYRSIVEAVRDLITKLEHEVRIRSSEIACAGIANQRESFVVWDAAGEALHPAILWQCKRSVSICEELQKAGYEHAVREKTGLIIDPYFSGTKLTWLVRNHPATRENLARGEAFFGTVDSWLLFRLTDGAVHATDHTNACRTLLFNIETLHWDDELARTLEVPDLRLPAAHPSAHHYGESDFGGALPRPVPITAMIGDSQSAFFGERCYEPGDTKATLGTGCSILVNAGDGRPEAYKSTMSTIGFSTPERLDYALEGIIVSAGSILTWLGRELGLFAEPEALEQAAIDAGESHGVVLIPAHSGLGAPFWRMDARGSIHGLTFGTTKEHILRAALESIPYQIRAILDAVKKESGVACASIRVDGGISRNRFVTQWLANTLAVPAHTYAMSDVTGLGAAFLAGLGGGIYSGIDEIAKLNLEESVHTPDSGQQAAEKAYTTWRGVVEQSIGMTDTAPH